jgi:hypothetical protein
VPETLAGFPPTLSRTNCVGSPKDVADGLGGGWFATRDRDGFVAASNVPDASEGCA